MVGRVSPIQTMRVIVVCLIGSLSNDFLFSLGAYVGFARGALGERGLKPYARAFCFKNIFGEWHFDQAIYILCLSQLLGNFLLIFGEK